jgi:hypothetical protein
MAEDTIKDKGALKSTKPGAGGGNTKDHPVIGIVKDNIDPTRSGKLKVQIEGSTGKDSNTDGGWVTVQYLSTYFGMVKPTAGQSGTGDYTSNPSAYGQWQSPPDIGTKVLCVFADGDANRGYYIGCVVEPEALQMIPAIGSSDNVVPNEGESQGLAGATRLPVTSINTNNKAQADSTNYLDAPKPVHSYSASIMSQQGIIRDPIRGPISSSASREPMSRVGWGVATPGRPIMEGGYDDKNIANNLDPKNQEQLKVTARRGGHSIVMDDGDIVGRDQLIRIRTALGHQIMMSDDGQTLMILHSNGQSYIELGKEGTVDIYSTNSFNVRTQGDINFHADQHINFHATENMNIQAKNLHINTEEDFKMRSGKKMQLYSVEDFTVKSLGAAAIRADGEASLFSSAKTFINGTKVNLNTGKPGVTPDKVPIITLITQTDTLHDEQKGFIAAPGKLLTVTTRSPAHYPWSAAGQGVDVKSSLDAAKNLPVTPSAGVQKANQAGAASGAKPPAIATVASAPDTKTVSKSMDKTVTNAVMGSVATNAATGPSKAATTSGAAIVSGASSGTAKTVAVGAFAQSPEQLATAGVIKPGSATLINGLAQQPGAALDNIMTTNLFTGKPGAVDLPNFISDVTAQTTAVATTMQKAQTTLGKVGAVTGKEAPTQLAGMVMASATVGVESTVAAVKSLATGASNFAEDVTATLNDPIAGLQGIAGLGGLPDVGAQAKAAVGQATTALKAIGAGGAAAGLAQSLGGLGGISNAAKGLSKGLGNLGKSLGGLFGGAGGGGDGPTFTDLVESVKGPAAAAFSSIRDSLKPLQVGVPQNLSSIAKSAATTAATISSSASGIVGPAADALNSILTAPEAITSVTDLTGILENNSVAGISGAFNQVKAQFGTLSTQVSGDATRLISQIGNAANTSVSGVQQLSSAFGSNGVATLTNLTKSFTDVPNLIESLPTSIGSFNDPMNTVNNIFTNMNTIATGINSTLPASATNINYAITNVNNAVKDVSGMIGAGPAINSGDNKALAIAAAGVQEGASAARSSAVASGVNNLPGGLAAVGAVMNNLEGAVNELPGTAALGGLIKNVQTSALTGITNTAEGITNSINNTLGGVLGKEGGLTNLITSALPLGAATGLLSSLSALGAGGPAKVKMPTISFNTFDRAGLTNQIKTILQNPKIPLPNLVGEIEEGVIKQLDQLIKKGKDSFKVFDDLEQWDQRIKDAQDRLYELESSLPAGDKGIESARKQLDSLFKSPEYTSLLKKADDFQESVTTNLTSLMSSANQTATNMLGTAKLGAVVENVKSSALDAFQQATRSATNTSVKATRGQGATAITQMQSKASSNQADLNNSIAGIVGPSVGETFI